ncbi:MAG: helix-turn-helix domain-containing protein [Allosphingosinicella sp.]|jgi:excisionase family DNA binding protein
MEQAEEMQMLSNDLIQGAREAARFSGLTERSIYHMAESGQLPVIRKGRRLYFRKSELEKAFSSEG